MQLLTAGVDEAGRGPLAGPVVAAAVVLDPARPIEGLRDSKRLTLRRRVHLAGEIRRNARAFAIGHASVAEIDIMNILNASLLAMRRAVERLRIAPTQILVDGNRVPELPDPHVQLHAIVGGDDSIPEISAASILAKVCRDRLLQRLDRQFPVYGFAQHKGYPTAVHIRALREHGPCDVHRRSFAPVRRVLQGVR
ncbi:MAG: ribonuclease HII [Gammaproteobacteria bacterium]|nr:ribonuclease HII [Gammaproteobacteria bacterium]